MRELRLIGAVGIHHPHLLHAGAVADERDLLAVRRIGRVVVVAGGRQLLEAGAVGSDDVDVVVHVGVRGGAVEHDFRCVRRVIREGEETASVRHQVGIRAVGVHRPDLERTGAVAAEGDQPPVTRRAALPHPTGTRTDFTCKPAITSPSSCRAISHDGLMRSS